VKLASELAPSAGPLLEDPDSLASAATAVAPRRPGAGTVLRRLARAPLAVIGLLIILVWVIVAIAWPALVPYAPTAIHVDSSFAPPSAQFVFGTDQLGRDVFSRVLAGSRDVLIVAPTATLIGLSLGTLLGLIAGYYGGLLGDVLMRAIDVVMSFPLIVLALLILATFGSSALSVILVIGFVFAPHTARVVRSVVLGLRETNFVAAAKLRGESDWYILLAELLPNARAPIVVEGTVRVGYAIFASATLSFLGLGVPPPASDWGLQVAEARNFLQTAPWMALFPSLAIASLVVAVNLVADGLKRAVAES
jgi:peptide/nickel transport system permease protein